MRWTRRHSKRAALVPASSLADPSDRLIEMLGGPVSPAGVQVSDQVARQISTYWACVRVVAEDVAKLPIVVARRLERGSERLGSSALHYLLNVQPNPMMGAMVFRECLLQWTLTWGNGIAEIEWDGAGRPVALWPIPTPYVTPVLKNGQLLYEVRAPNGRPVTLEADSVFHLRGLGPDGLWGWSVLRMARETLGAAASANRFASSMFARGVKASGVLSHPGKLTPAAMANLKSFQDSYGGTENAHKTIILEEGMTWTPTSMTPEDAQMLETRRFDVEEICRWFRVAPHKVQSLDKATYSNIEHQGSSFVGDSLQGWMTKFEQEVQIKLIGVRSAVYARHNASALVRGDYKTRMEGHSLARQGGWMSADDIRELEDMNPLPEGIGGVYTVGAGVQNAESVARGTPAPGEPAPAAEPDSAGLDEEEERSLVSLASLALEPLIRVEADKLRRSIARGDVLTWAHGFYDESRIDRLCVPLTIAAESVLAAAGHGAMDDVDVRAVRSWCEAHVASSRAALVNPEKALQAVSGAGRSSECAAEFVRAVVEHARARGKERSDAGGKGTRAANREDEAGGAGGRG